MVPLPCTAITLWSLSLAQLLLYGPSPLHMVPLPCTLLYGPSPLHSYYSMVPLPCTAITLWSLSLAQLLLYGPSPLHSCYSMVPLPCTAITLWSLSLAQLLLYGPSPLHSCTAYSMVPLPCTAITLWSLYGPSPLHSYYSMVPLPCTAITLWSLSLAQLLLYGPSPLHSYYSMVHSYYLSPLHSYYSMVPLPCTAMRRRPSAWRSWCWPTLTTTSTTRDMPRSARPLTLASYPGLPSQLFAAVQRFSTLRKKLRGEALVQGYPNIQLADLLQHFVSLQICYTQGTVDGLELARKHFATAIKLNPENMRALYGFCLVWAILNWQPSL